jgi:hypothetical protein
MKNLQTWKHYALESQIMQLGIISHNKIFQTLFTHELVQNKTNQLN